MAKFIDYYKIMGVAKDTPQSEIKAAFRRRSKQFHPDLHPDDPKAKAKFQLLTEAYEVLSDPDKRARYDQYGENWDKMNGGGFGGGNSAGADPFGGFNPFGSGNPFMGGNGGSYEFHFGGNGGGFSDFFSQLFGQGAARQQARQNGRQGRGASAEPTETQAEISIDLYTALLGGTVEIQNGQEKLRLKIKPSTQPGTKMRLKGKGNGGTDLILTINVKLPTDLSERQQQLVREMQTA